MRSSYHLRLSVQTLGFFVVLVTLAVVFGAVTVGSRPPTAEGFATPPSRSLTLPAIVVRRSRARSDTTVSKMFKPAALMS